MRKAPRTVTPGRPSGWAARGASAAAGATLAGLLAACGGGGGSSGTDAAPATRSISPDVHVFRADLGGWSPNNGRWYSYQVSDSACDLGLWFPTNGISLASCLRWLTPPEGPTGAWIRSTGPWWVDPNHMQQPGGSGLGFIHVLAFAQLPAGFRSPANLDGTVLSFSARIDEQFSTPVADSRDGRRQGHIYFWFQTFPRQISPCTPDATIGENCTRQSDYILTGGWDPAYGIDRITPNQEQAFSFALNASEPGKWTCLGRGVNVKYDCMGLPQALKNVAYVGFVIAPVAPCPTLADAEGMTRCDAARIASAPRDHLAVGSFELRGVDIRKSRQRNAVGRRIEFAADTGAKTADGWSAPRYAAGAAFAPGSGLQLTVGRTTRALRLGLGSAPDSSTVSGAGVQIYLSRTGSSPSQPDDLLVVMARDDNGGYDRAEVFWPYRDGDTVGLYLDDGALLVLKNDEVVYQGPSPCGSSADCTLHPFIASHGGSGELPPVYRY